MKAYGKEHGKGFVSTTNLLLERTSHQLAALHSVQPARTGGLQAGITLRSPAGRVMGCGCKNSRIITLEGLRALPGEEPFS